MATSKKSNTKDLNPHWYESPIKKGVAIISGFLVVAGVGYAYGVYQTNVKFELEKIEMKQDFNEKLQEQINKCKEEQQELENKRVENIETVVQELKKHYDGEK